MQGFGNHRGWSSVVGSGYLNGLAWLLALTLVAALAAEAFWATQSTELVETTPRHVGDPRATTVQIMQRLSGVPAQSNTSAATQVAESADSLTLVGLATGFEKDRGFALFMRGDGEVYSVLAGEAGPDGHTVLGIHADHVIVERNGVSRKIVLSRPSTPDADANSAPPPSAQLRAIRTP